MSSISTLRILVLVSALVFAAGISSAVEADAGIGEMAESADGVVIVNASWADEWVEIENYGEVAQDFTG